MPRMTGFAVVAMGAIFFAADVAPAQAQVMKNFSWKKKAAKPKSHDAAADPAEPAVSKRQKAKTGN